MPEIRAKLFSGKYGRIYRAYISEDTAFLLHNKCFRVLVSKEHEYLVLYLVPEECPNENRNA